MYLSSDRETVRTCSSGKCFELPVTKQSAAAAAATSRNIASLGSGNWSLSGPASTGRPFVSTTRRTSSTRSRSKENLPRVSTSRYSARIRSSKSSVTMPVRTDRRIAAGGPNGDMNPDTNTLVSSTIFNQCAGAFGMRESPRQCRPSSIGRDRALPHRAAGRSGHRWLCNVGFLPAIFRTSRYPSPSIWPRASHCSL